MVVALLYHDVITGSDESSGFLGSDAAEYKLDEAEFRQHVACIANRLLVPAVSVFDLLPRSPLETAFPSLRGNTEFIVTFDDGGASAHTLIPEIIEPLQWRGHFFMTTDYIDTPGFLTRGQLRDLHAQGHVIGSHSCSHPPRMSMLNRNHLYQEWQRSVSLLENILGSPVKTASVPGGHYSRRVAEAASRAGIEILFTSEPTTTWDKVHGCMVIGRYTIQRGVRAITAADIAAGALVPRSKQWAFWNTKKMAKKVGGKTYLRLREAALDAKHKFKF